MTQIHTDPADEVYSGTAKGRVLTVELYTHKIQICFEKIFPPHRNKFA